jgi:hypothetical protein
MIRKNLDDINEEDLKKIVESQRLEDQTIEYKGKLWEINDNKGKHEFYKDITAFANADGGDIIVGIAEDKQKYPRLEGLKGKPDEVILRLNQMIECGIEPSIIPAPKIISVKLKGKEEKFVIIIRVFKSLTAPHRISISSNHKFYIRINNNSVEMSITQLRNAFNLSGNLVERIQKFRTERLQKLISYDTPVPLGEDNKDNAFHGKLMLHIIPFQSFLSTQYVDINDEKILELLKEKLKPIEIYIGIYGSGYSPIFYNRYNLDGFLTFATNKNNEIYSYVQFFRNGIIEAVSYGVVYAYKNTLPVKDFKNCVTNSGFIYLNLLKDLNISPPICIFLTLYEVDGSEILSPSTDMLNYLIRKKINKTPSFPILSGVVDRNLLQFPEVVVDKFVSNQSELESILKPIFDALWNAYGHKSP